MISEIKIAEREKINTNLVKDVINPTERQREFMRTVNASTYTLYGGAAGGGKSYILRWELIYLLIKWFKSTGIKGIRVGLFCEDYPSLRDRQLSKIKLEFPSWLGRYRDSPHEFTLSEQLGGGVICFRNLDDPSRYLSSEFAAIAIDELTLNDQSVFDFLRMRLRWPGIRSPKFIAGTNPGGRGHGWVKNLFVDRNLSKEMQKYADKIAFVRAKVSDNPYLPDSYTESLKTLPDAMRKAYLDGSWDIFEGQVFTEFDRRVHIVEPFALPPSWTRLRSMDWGFTKPYCVLWGAVDPDGCIYVYRELYGCKAGMADVGTQETAQEVAQKVRNVEQGEAIAYGVADPACWAHTGHGEGYTINEYFSAENVYWSKADNDRLAGKNEVHTRLRDGKLKIFSTCTGLIRTLPTLVYDTKSQHIEDVDTTQEDHPYDTLRYMLMSRPLNHADDGKQKHINLPIAGAM